MALAVRGGQVPGLAFHTDQGTEREPRRRRSTSATLTVTSFMTGLIGRWLAGSG